MSNEAGSKHEYECTEEEPCPDCPHYNDEIKVSEKKLSDIYTEHCCAGVACSCRGDIGID